VLAVLGLVEAGALSAAFFLRSSVDRAELGLAALLVSLSVTYSLVVVGWEKARQFLLYERTPTTTPDLLATWCFAAAIMLPMQLSATVTVLAAIGEWRLYNLAGRKVLYRYVYSTAAAVLAGAAAHGAASCGLPHGINLVAAAVAWIVTMPASIALVMWASGQVAPIRAMLHPRSLRIEVVTVGIALLEYGCHACRLPLLWLSLPAAVGVHRIFTRSELRNWERPDRLMSEDAWLAVARAVVDISATCTIVRVNAADATTARTVAMMNAGCDAIGSYGKGAGIAILLADCPPENGDALARRLRTALTVRGVNCQVAAASTPRDGQLLEDLLAISEAELLARDAATDQTAASG